MSFSEDEKESEENVLYSFPAFDAFERDYGDSKEKLPPLVLELIPLPLLSENFEQMPVGARGWYASAMLSAMMMMSYSGSNSVDAEQNYCANNLDDDDAGERTKGIDLMRNDLKRACAAVSCATTNKSNIFLELGSGTIGLGGMTMAWIVAQHAHNNRKTQDPSTARNKIVMTDYDPDCLEQLERNAVGVRRTFGQYFKDSSTVNDFIPDINVEKLDWNEYDQDQSPILPDCTTTEEGGDENSISFVCGAALVYTEDTAACVDQVAKILKRHPRAVVWVVQWPRNGWFSVFQQELQSSKFRARGLHIAVQKFGPSSSPDMFSAQVQGLAQKLLPFNMHQEVEMNIKDLRAIRIRNTVL